MLMLTRSCRSPSPWTLTLTLTLKQIDWQGKGACTHVLGRPSTLSELRERLVHEESMCNATWRFSGGVPEGQRSLLEDSIWAVPFADSKCWQQCVVLVDFDQKAIALCCPSGSMLGTPTLFAAIAAFVAFAKQHVLGQTNFSFDGWVYGALSTSILTIDAESSKWGIRTHEERAAASAAANVPFQQRTYPFVPLHRQCTRAGRTCSSRSPASPWASSCQALARRWNGHASAPASLQQSTPAISPTCAGSTCAAARGRWRSGSAPTRSAG